MAFRWGRFLTLTVAVLVGAALVLEFQSHADDVAAHIAVEKKFLHQAYEHAVITGPYQVIDGGCGVSSSGIGFRWPVTKLIPQRVYVVEIEEHKFPVGVCRDESLPLGYRVVDDLPLRY